MAEVTSQVQRYSYVFTTMILNQPHEDLRGEEVKEGFRSNNESRQRTDGYDNVKAEWKGESGITEGIRTRLS